MEAYLSVVRSPFIIALSVKPSLIAVGTVTTVPLDFFTVSYCMSMVRSLSAASGSP